MWVIAVIMVVAGACALYLLSNQRVTNPFDNSYTIKAEFQNASATAPASARRSTSRASRSVRSAASSSRTGAGSSAWRSTRASSRTSTAARPRGWCRNTPLKDMQVDLTPGDPKAGAMHEGDTIAIATPSRRSTPTSSCTRVDSDTREYLRLLISDTGAGLEDRGPDLRALLRTLGPTSAQVRDIAALLRTRRTVVRAAAGSQPPGAQHRRRRRGRLDSAHRQRGQRDARCARLAGRCAAHRDRRAAGTLRVARTTLAQASPFARSLRRTLTDLEPAVPRLRQTLQDTPDSLRGFLPLPLKQLKQFTDATVPLAPLVRSASANIGGSLAPLAAAFGRLATRRTCSGSTRARTPTVTSSGSPGSRTTRTR